jgi:hypothetical protein
MYLKSLVVKNFRALENIEVNFDNRVNVIVGPNAIGKTTVLEAIRLAKALLAPRTQTEPNQVLISMGALAPHNQQLLILEAIARDVTRPIEVRCRYELTESELATIEGSVPQLATMLVQSRMGQGFANPVSLVTFLSSPGGQAALMAADGELREGLKTVRSENRTCRLDLTLTPGARRVEGGDPLGQMFIAFLDQRNPPSLTTFSYFPADRAMRAGEQPVQIGAADAGQQIESHNSQPQIKYDRLKNTIFNAIVLGAQERAKLEQEFVGIFNGVLKSAHSTTWSLSEY